MMKKIVLGSIVSLSLLSAGCLIENKFDKDMFENYDNDGGCFNATDGDSLKSITTKIAGKEFSLYVHKYCSTSNAKYAFHDMITDKNISDPQDVTTDISAEFNTSYKNVKVIFEYDKTTTEIARTAVECPWAHKTNFMESKISMFYPTYKKTADIDDEDEGGSYYENVGQCYTISLKPNTKHYIEYSTDNFAIRPSKFNITFKNNKVFTGDFVAMDIESVNGHSDITDNYSGNSSTLDVSFSNSDGSDSDVKVSYYFQLANGKLNNYQLKFKRAAHDIKMNLIEKVGQEWAIVDADDTKDSCRLVSGESNEINVTETSKNWAGFGTGSDVSNPSSQTISTEVRENTDKDIRFK